MSRKIYIGLLLGAVIFGTIALLRMCNTGEWGTVAPIKLMPFKNEVWSGGDSSDVGSEDILNLSKNDIILSSQKELLVYACNGYVFVTFKKDGQVYEKRKLFYYKYPNESNDFLIRTVYLSSYKELKEYLKEIGSDALLGSQKNENLSE